MAKFPSFFSSIFIRMGALVPESLHPDSEEFRKGRLVVLVLVASMLFLASFGALYALISFTGGVWACVYGMAVAVILLILFRFTGKITLTTVLYDLNAMVLFGLICAGSGGIHSPVQAWFTIIPVTGFVFGGAVRGLVMSALCGLAVAGFAIADYTGYEAPVWYDQTYANLLSLIVYIGLLMYISLVVLLYEVSKDRRIRELDHLNQALLEGRRIIEQSTLALQLQNDEISRINSHLEDLVRERTSHLNLAKAELDTFLYEASHALRRPLARIMGLVQIIRSTPEKNVADNMQVHIDTTASRMDDMLRKLTLVSEINSGEVRRELRDIAQLTDGAIQRFRELPGAAFIRVEIQIPAGLKFETDAHLFSTSIYLLLENCLMFAHPSRPLLIHLTISAANRMLSAKIRDNGMGVEEENLPLLTGMFFRATAASTGSGLGLYVVEKALSRLGGKISFSSQPGECLEVEVLLPRETTGI